MYYTKNSLDQKIRIESISLLQDRLSNGLDVLLQTKQAHWNVKGENFFALHKLFDRVSVAALDWVDTIAERIMQLGGVAEGTVRMTASRTRMPEYPLTISSGIQHVEALSEALAFFGELVRTASADALKFGDTATADIFVKISKSVDKYLWMVEAHSQAERSIEAREVA